MLNSYGASNCRTTKCYSVPKAKLQVPRIGNTCTADTQEGGRPRLYRQKARLPTLGPLEVKVCICAGVPRTDIRERNVGLTATPYFCSAFSFTIGAKCLELVAVGSRIYSQIECLTQRSALVGSVPPPERANKWMALRWVTPRARHTVSFHDGLVPHRTLDAERHQVCSVPRAHKTFLRRKVNPHEMFLF